MNLTDHEKKEALAAANAANQFALKSANNGRVNAALDLAQDRPGMPILHQQMNRDQFLFNCPNGTIDLRTGELREHRRSDFITVLCPTKFTPHESPPNFLHFLDSIFGGNQEIIGFVRRWFGYSLTGSVREQILPVLYGDGSNGKSTLLNAIIETMGSDYAMQADPHLLMANRDKASQHSTYLASLFGKRFVSTVETESGRSINESFVKQLTGGERIRCRRMREDEWEFSPTHKIVLCTNHKPIVKGNDHAIWRRLALVPFDIQFWNPDKGETGPEELKQDKELPEKLKAEAEGILSWMVQGCLEWQAEGLMIPEAVRLATNDYRSEQDVIGRFVQECCITHDANMRVKFGDLFEALEKFCEESGEDALSKRRLGDWLKQNGFHQKRDAYARWYVGIGTKAFQ